MCYYQNYSVNNFLNFDKNRMKFSLRKIDGEKTIVCFRDKTHLYNPQAGD